MNRTLGSKTFHELLKEAGQLHAIKAHDYASEDDPYGNYRFAGMMSQLFKSPEDAGFIGRIGEKLFRLANLENSGKEPKNESIEDTERDLCTIMILWISMRRDRRKVLATLVEQIQDGQADRV